MANISREQERRDDEIRKQNNGNWPYTCTDKIETREEAIERTDAEVKAGLRKLRELKNKK